MSITQPIDLVVWVGPGREFCPILEHTRIKTPGGDIMLRTNLSAYMMPADVPKQPGLHLVKGMAHVHQRPGYGYECRLIFEYSVKIVGGLAEIAEEGESKGVFDA